MTEKLIKSLLNSPTIKKQKTKKVLAIGRIENNTKQNIDIEIIANEIINLLNESGNFEVVNAGRNAKIEQLIRDSRKMREDKEYNPYGTIEEGELIPPHYGLTGKISQRNKKSGDDEIVEYVFSLTLTSLKSGKILWAKKTKPISKKLPKEEVAKSSSYNYNSNSYSYNQSYSYSNDNDSDSWESVKEFFSFGADGRNHFTLGFDGGILNMGGAINIAHIDFTIIEQSTNYQGNITTKTTAHTVSANDSLYSFPLTARVGYLRDIGDNWAFGLNFIYNYMIASVSEYNIKTTATLDIDERQPTVKLHRIGGEAEIYYKFKDIPQHWGGGDIYMYLGGGVLKDLGSKVKITLEARRSSYYDYSINTTGQKRLSIERKIDSWYPIVKFGLIWYFNDYIGLSYELNYSWALSETSSVSSGFGWGVLGLRVKI